MAPSVPCSSRNPDSNCLNLVAGRHQTAAQLWAIHRQILLARQCAVCTLLTCGRPGSACQQPQALLRPACAPRLLIQPRTQTSFSSTFQGTKFPAAARVLL